ncbi:MAG: hypothetical protein HC882_09090 [Acidobacteria bacterium]|nr:hypothetical protein [Acidobacteriota bacterium]
MKRARSERGSVLVEFVLVVLVLVFLLAAIVELGRLVFTAQVVQDAARVAARELALVPLPADATFEDALADPLVRTTIFDDGLLVIDLDAFASDADYESFLATLPAVNQALRPAMIVDNVTIDGAPRRLLRYPGALVVDAGAAFGLSVTIPRVTARDARGVESLRFIPVMEEVRADASDPASGPFSLASPMRGGLGRGSHQLPLSSRGALGRTRERRRSLRAESVARDRRRRRRGRS